MKGYLHALLGSFFLLACTNTVEQKQTGQLVAEVFNAKLYLEDIEKNIPVGSKQDSAQMIRVLTEKWAREQIVLHEAEKEIGQVIAIEKLIEDYRSSLMVHNYEKILIEENLDTTITDEDLNFYYNENKADYSLKTDIFRCILIKVTNEAPRLSSLIKWWEKDDIDNILSYAEQYASLAIIQDSSWYTSEQVAEVIPRQIFNEKRVKENTKLNVEGDGFVYLFKVLDFIPKTEIAPISFIEGQAKRVILHNRKLDLVADLKERLYSKAVDNNQINIYIE